MWLHDKLYEGSNDVINKFVELGKKVYLLTNNSQTTREEMAAKCKKMHFNLDEDSMIPASYVTGQYLKHIGFNKTAYVIGPQALANELEAVGIATIGTGPDIFEGPLQSFVMRELPKMDKEVGAVVIGFDEHYGFPKLFKAVNYLRNPSTLLIASNPDQKIDFPSFTFPDSGPIIAAIENVTERKATIVGKPSKVLAEIVLKQEAHREGNRVLMIGDRLNTDILFGKRNNYQTLLVGSGEHSLKEVQVLLDQIEKGEGNEESELYIPDFHISALGRLFAKA